MVMTMLHTQEMQTYLHFMIFYLMTYVANKLHLCRINQHLDKNISPYARLMKHVVVLKHLSIILCFQLFYSQASHLRSDYILKLLNL